MVEAFRQYRPFFIFLLKFFGVYAGLTLLYSAYLNQFDATLFEVDGFTNLVARQTQLFTELFNYATQIPKHPSQPAIRLILDGHYVARVVEGCNAISVMILFMSFVVAFKGKLKTTFLFLLSGLALIHLLNVARIGLLAIALIHYKEYQELLHGVIFPAVIYGVVFLLWVIWVNKFSIYADAK